MTIQITDLFIYPVKSLQGIRLTKARADLRGLQDDRRWMLINEQNRFVTQRQLPALARVGTQLTDTELVLHCDGDRIAIPRTAKAGPIFDAQIWSDTVQVQDEGEALSRWLARHLDYGQTLRLVRLAAGSQRPQSKPWYLGADTHTVFADMAPLLVTNQASLDALNGALIDKGLQPVPMNRFRPNLVISGLPAFAEHGLKGLRSGEVQIRFAYPCERCVVPTIDQLTGAKHPGLEPFRTLQVLNSMPAYGEGEHAKPANPKAPAFGQNARLLGERSLLLAVGDTLEPL